MAIKKNKQDSIETERLMLIPYKSEDAEELFNYAKHPAVGPAAGWKPHSSVKESRLIIEGLFVPSGAWAIREKEGKALSPIIGTIALENDRFRPDAKSREIGYSLAYNKWGNGIMTEATMAVIKYAFDVMGLEILTICTSLTNKKSQRVIKKCHFVYEGTLRKCYRTYEGMLRDSMVFSLTKEDWISATKG